MKFLLPISIILFLLSLPFPVFEFEDTSPIMGYDVLMWGWWGLIMFNLGWISNVLWIIGITRVLKNRIKPALYFGIASAVLSLQGFTVSEWWFTEGSGTPVKSFGPGFYLWLSVMFTFLAQTILLYKAKK